MGQLYSCASSEFEINSKKPSNIQRIALPHGIISHIHQGREENIKQCLNIFHNIKETPKNDEWKSLMIKKLNNLNNQEWSNLLSKTLKEYKINYRDRNNQTEIMEYFSQSQRKEATGIKEQDETPNGAFSKENIDTNTNSNLRVNYTENDSPYSPKTADLNTPKFSKMTSSKDQSELEELSTDYKDDRKQELNISVSHFEEEADESLESNTQNNTKKRSPGTSKIFSSHYEGSKILKQWNNDKKRKYDFLQSRIKEKESGIFILIEKHLNKKTNVFRKLATQFEKYFLNYYENKMKSSQCDKTEIKQEESVKATLELQQFISMFYEAIIAYYSLEKIKQNQTNSEEAQLLNRDNMMSFITYIVLSERIYDVLFSFYCWENNSAENLYKNNKAKRQNKGPEFFGIEDEYCLNIRTKDFFEKKKRRIFNESLTNALSTLPDIEKSEGEPAEKSNETKNNNKEGSVLSENSLQKTSIGSNRRTNIEANPYNEVIIELNKINDTKNPNGKLSILLKAAEKINKCIDTYYNKIGEVNEKKLDAEQTLSIFVYLLIQSDLENVEAHCMIIENFTTGNILNSISGYYATTLRACFDHVCELETQITKENELKRN